MKLVIAIIAALAAVPSRAHAQGSPTTFPDIGVGVEVFGAVVFAPPAVIDTIHVAKHERGRTVWPALGIGCGVAGVTLGLAFALPNAGSTDSNAGAKIGVGWGLAVEGAYNLGLAIWALTLPREVRASPSAMAARRPRWAVAPLAARDSAGRRVDGVALAIRAF
jgi:hypothetical protein